MYFGGRPLLWLLMDKMAKSLKEYDLYSHADEKDTTPIYESVRALLLKKYPKATLEVIIGHYAVVKDGTKRKCVICCETNPIKDLPPVYDKVLEFSQLNKLKLSKTQAIRSLKSAFLVYSRQASFLSSDSIMKTYKKLVTPLDEYMRWIVECPQFEIIERATRNQETISKVRVSNGMWCAIQPSKDDSEERYKFDKDNEDRPFHIPTGLAGSYFRDATPVALFMDLVISYYGLIIPMIDPDGKVGKESPMFQEQSQLFPYSKLIMKDSTLGSVSLEFYIKKRTKEIQAYDKIHKAAEKLSKLGTHEMATFDSATGKISSKTVNTEWKGKIYGVHQGEAKIGQRGQPKRGAFILTHLPSGQQIQIFQRKNDAITVAKTLEKDAPIDSIRMLKVDADGSVKHSKKRTPIKFGMQTPDNYSVPVELKADFLIPLGKVLKTFDFEIKYLYPHYKGDYTKQKSMAIITKVEKIKSNPSHDWIQSAFKEIDSDGTEGSFTRYAASKGYTTVEGRKELAEMIVKSYEDWRDSGKVGRPPYTIRTYRRAVFLINLSKV